MKLNMMSMKLNLMKKLRLGSILSQSLESYQLPSSMEVDKRMPFGRTESRLMHTHHQSKNGKYAFTSPQEEEDSDNSVQ